MSDRTFEILLVTVLALVPGNTAHYIYLGLASASLAYHVARRQTPAAKINDLTAAIASAKERLTRAPSTSVKDHMLLMDQKLLLRM